MFSTGTKSWRTTATTTTAFSDALTGDLSMLMDDLIAMGLDVIQPIDPSAWTWPW